MGFFKKVKSALGGGGNKKAAAEAQALADAQAAAAARAKTAEAVRATQVDDGEGDLIRRKMQEQFGGRKSRASAVLIGSPTVSYNRERLG